MTARTENRPVSILVLRHFATPLNAGQGAAERSRSWSGVGIDREEAEPLAEKAARIFERRGVKVITGSDLPRAVQSMKLVASKMKERPQVEPSAQARTWNTGEAGKPEKESREQRKKFVKHPDEAMPGGESFSDFRNRFRPFLEGQLAQAKRNPEIKRAIVMHGHEVMDAENQLNSEPMKDQHWARLDEIKPGHAMELVDEGGRATLRQVSD